MLEERSTHSITYNEFVVISVKVISYFVFVRTYNKNTNEIFWFIGFKTNEDINQITKKTLTDGACYPNQYFKKMFEENYKKSNIKLEGKKQIETK